MFRAYLRSLAACTLSTSIFVGTSCMSSFAEQPSPNFDRIGADALAPNKAPGFSFAVVFKDQLVYAKGFGVADISRNTLVQAQTRFAVGSITKQFTAACILLQVQQGKLVLDDPLRKVPSFVPMHRRSRCACFLTKHRDCTTIHILTNTTGP